jgi:hypothetical protein
MKKDKNIPAANELKSNQRSDPINQFKKGSKGATVASVDKIITSPVESVKAKTGKGLANEGSTADYNEER